MFRYYFNVHDALITEDQEGSLLANDRAARDYAIAAARALAADCVSRGYIVFTDQIHVLDADHLFVETVNFGDAVRTQR